MDYKRLVLTAVVAWVVDTLYGLGVWSTMLRAQFAQYPAVFRSEQAMNAHLPLTFAGGLLGIFVLTYIYAQGFEGGSGVKEGFRFGVLIALFTFGFVSIGIYGSFNLGRRIAAMGSIASFVEMILLGVVIGALYRPAARAEGGTAA